ncbi:tetrahydrofolate synthase [Pneumocystis jirovecii RU7]|uniref:Folylpolyglutamate synthase n=1 Tax=Pneumocystis jirovecii (strain RU7) TaxID=1408657 RepID=A0A0W4ZDZ7_PNEJ7|nr:tetrahydrofolate synthase [Pneumocystis jirovecii RU7]KTW26594.1 hypothetical protein T551_03511 [Pneumocystis jirovecii RU7]
MISRSYKDAISALNTLQTNSQVLRTISNSKEDLNKQSLSQMVEWLHRIGYKIDDVNKLNVIHIAGTKGKGSTCAFISSILEQLRNQYKKSIRFGMYTSPHLVAVRERIRINGIPISETLFAKYFFEVWDCLEKTAIERKLDPTIKPSYFRYLTLMSWHVFISEKVDTLIMETGIGGEYDSTNIIQHPTVTGITSLGIDHVPILGNTIEKISWHKGGIFKKNVPALTVEQSIPALNVLKKRASERKALFSVITINPDLKKIKLGLSGDFQYINASLAFALVSYHLPYLNIPSLNSLYTVFDTIKTGLENASWPGRCQLRKEDNISWYMDGAHTTESIKEAVIWYTNSIFLSNNSPRKFILIFNQQTRDAAVLLESLYNSIIEKIGENPFYMVIFPTNVTWKDGTYDEDLVNINSDIKQIKSLKIQYNLRDYWIKLNGNNALINVIDNIEDTVNLVRSQATLFDIDVFITGSLHLIGGFLTVLDRPKS